MSVVTASSEPWKGAIPSTIIDPALDSDFKQRVEKVKGRTFAPHWRNALAAKRASGWFWIWLTPLTEEEERVPKDREKSEVNRQLRRDYNERPPSISLVLSNFSVTTGTKQGRKKIALDIEKKIELIIEQLYDQLKQATDSHSEAIEIMQSMCLGNKTSNKLDLASDLDNEKEKLEVSNQLKEDYKNRPPSTSLVLSNFSVTTGTKQGRKKIALDIEKKIELIIEQLYDQLKQATDSHSEAIEIMQSMCLGNKTSNKLNIADELDNEKEKYFVIEQLISDYRTEKGVPGFLNFFKLTPENLNRELANKQCQTIPEVMTEIYNKLATTTDSHSVAIKLMKSMLFGTEVSDELQLHCQDSGMIFGAGKLKKLEVDVTEQKVIKSLDATLREEDNPLLGVIPIVYTATLKSVPAGIELKGQMEDPSLETQLTNAINELVENCKDPL